MCTVRGTQSVCTVGGTQCTLNRYGRIGGIIKAESFCGKNTVYLFSKISTDIFLLVLNCTNILYSHVYTGLFDLNRSKKIIDL